MPRLHFGSAGSGAGPERRTSCAVAQLGDACQRGQFSARACERSTFDSRMPHVRALAMPIKHLTALLVRLVNMLNG